MRGVAQIRYESICSVAVDTAGAMARLKHRASNDATEIQDRCCQGLRASPASHRPMVDAEAAIWQRAASSRAWRFRISGSASASSPSSGSVHLPIAALGFLDADLEVSNHARLVHGERPGLQVDVGPAEPQDFAAPQAVHAEPPGSMQPAGRRGFEELAALWPEEPTTVTPLGCLPLTHHSRHGGQSCRRLPL